MTTINNEVITAYWWCSRKAHLLNATEQLPFPPYVVMLDRMKDRARTQVNALHPGVTPGEQFDPTKNLQVFVDIILQNGDLEASCDLLTRLPDPPHPHGSLYEPTIVGGTHQVTADQKLELAFVGHVLGQIQRQVPATGTIVSANGQVHRIKLQKHYSELPRPANMQTSRFSNFSSQEKRIWTDSVPADGRSLPL